MSSPEELTMPRGPLAIKADVAPEHQPSSNDVLNVFGASLAR